MIGSLWSRKGHRVGGLSRLFLLALVVAGCGGSVSPREPSPRDGGVLRPLQVYRQLGLLTGSEQFPAVASFATMAGPNDSTFVLFGLSLPNSALRFRRDGDAFTARYQVTLIFYRDSQEVRRVSGTELVRVASFDETSRTDESIVYQTVVALPPGEYEVAVEARDGSGARGFRAQDTLDVPAYRSAQGPRRLTDPFFVYQAEARSAVGEAPAVIVNPRHTIPYGGEAPRLYLEAYGYPAGQPVRVRVKDAQDRELWETTVRLVSGGGEGEDEGNGGFGYAFFDIPAASLPIGRLWIETSIEGEAEAAGRVPLVVTISDHWTVANFDELLEFLAYIATPAELDSLRNATGEERQELWERFWKRRDPLSATAVNEFREQFFERIRTAMLYFQEPLQPGWKTDRGEVYIVLGPPDHVYEHFGQVAGRPVAYEWIYERGPTGRLELVFQDRRGIERYELTPSSRAAFRSAAHHLRNRMLAPANRE